MVDNSGSSSESDDSPEGISFQESKENALDSIHSIKNSLRRDKDLIKEKRKAIEQRNIKQKKRKALGLDFLEQVDEALEEKKAVKRIAPAKKPVEDSEDLKKKSTKQTVSDDTSGKVYVPIAKTQRFIKPPDDTASNFKDRMLNRKETKRMEISDVRMIQAKKAAQRRR